MFRKIEKTPKDFPTNLLKLIIVFHINIQKLYKKIESKVSWDLFQRML